jgi:hypothetical protein
LDWDCDSLLLAWIRAREAVEWLLVLTETVGKKPVRLGRCEMDFR